MTVSVYFIWRQSNKRTTIMEWRVEHRINAPQFNINSKGNSWWNTSLEQSKLTNDPKIESVFARTHLSGKSIRVNMTRHGYRNKIIRLRHVFQEDTAHYFPTPTTNLYEHRNESRLPYIIPLTKLYSPSFSLRHTNQKAWAIIIYKSY